MAEKRGMKPLDLGATGEQVAMNVARYRNARNMTYQGLAQALSDNGWAIPELGLRRIESRARRVSADDLLALAIALNVSPLALLLAEESAEDPLPTAAPADVVMDEIWAWARGNTNLTVEARIQYWETQYSHWEDRLETAVGIEESDAAKKDAKFRNWARRQKRIAEQKMISIDARLVELGASPIGKH